MNQRPFMWTITILSLLVLNSCTKIDWEDFYKHPDKAPRLCDIKKISVLDNQGTEWYNLTFSYNRWGNPTLVKRSAPVLEAGDRLFFYDQKQQLTDYLTVSGTAPDYNGYFRWNKYVWNRGRIIIDTLRTFGSLVNGRPIPKGIDQPDMEITYYEYDRQDRIIKTRTVIPFFLKLFAGASITKNFTYNNAGNLTQIVKIDSVRNTPVTSITTVEGYNDKISLLRTNNIWMFLTANYSVNATVSYEASFKGLLPAKLRLPELPFGGTGYKFLTDDDIGQSNIDYSCK
jgi:hypothetical protein